MCVSYVPSKYGHTYMKRKSSLEMKYEIIQCVEISNELKKDVAITFDILPKTLSKI